MKYQPTPADDSTELAEVLAAINAYIPKRDRRPHLNTEALKLALIRNGWADPQTITINTDIYVAANTAARGRGCCIFVKGAPGAYEIQLCGADPLIGADLQMAHIPSPGVMAEIWRLLNTKD